MSFLTDNLEHLKSDLTASPMRIAAHKDMPCAIFRYAPGEEFALRKELRLMAIKLEQECGRRVTFLSLARLVWDAVRAHGGTEYLFKTEALRGFDAAQHHIYQLLNSSDFEPAADKIAARIAEMDSEKDLVFFVRAGGFAPGIYRVSVLLDSLDFSSGVPVVLFYPGSARIGTDLRFYDMPSDGGIGVYNYRVRIYGAET